MTQELIVVSSIAHGGAGIGRPEVADGEPAGLTWFVPGALPGERVMAQADHRARRFVRGRLLSVVEAAPTRVQPPCPIADECGGCSWQHVAVAEQGPLKRRIVADQLRDLVDDAKVVLDPGGTTSMAYRRRARLHYERTPDGGLRMGFFAEGSRTLVDVTHCPVLVPALNAALVRLRAHADVLRPSGEVHALTDGTHVVLALPGIKPEPATIARVKAMLGGELVGVLLRGGRQTHSVGRTRLAIDGVDGQVPVTVNALSFAQAHAERNAALVRHVVGRARPDGQRVLELFCGAGNFTRGLARSARRVWALDDDGEAVNALRALAEEHRLPVNAKRGSATSWLARMATNGTTYDVVVLDPTRRGLGQDEAANLARVAAGRIVYVSCDPATLARDLKILVAKGWGIRDVTVFDLMPMTPEVETVVTLSPTGPRGAA